MNANEIRKAVNEGHTVHWANEGYTVIKDGTGDYLIWHYSGNCIGLTWLDGETLNGKPEDFYIAAPFNDSEKQEFIEAIVIAEKEGEQ